jgi:hypothetical protein
VRTEKWGNFIKEGNKSLEREQHDKTMILGGKAVEQVWKNEE